MSSVDLKSFEFDFELSVDELPKLDLDKLLSDIPWAKKPKSPRKFTPKPKTLASKPKTNTEKLGQKVQDAKFSRRSTQKSGAAFGSPEQVLAQNFQLKKSTTIDETFPPTIRMSRLDARLFLKKEGEKRKIEAETGGKKFNRAQKRVSCCTQLTKPKLVNGKKGKRRILPHKTVLRLSPPKLFLELIDYENDDIKQSDFLGSFELIKKDWS